jgi:hypothetical protein
VTEQHATYRRITRSFVVLSRLDNATPVFDDGQVL